MSASKVVKTVYFFGFVELDSKNKSTVILKKVHLEVHVVLWAFLAWCFDHSPKVDPLYILCI